MGCCCIAEARPYPVRLSVYSIVPQGMNVLLSAVGIGAFHTAVEVDGVEYAFGPGGVYQSPLHCPPEGMEYVTSIEMGTVYLSPEGLRGYIQQQRRCFPAEHYDLLSCNCNHFTDTFCRQLRLPPIPPELNQLASVGRGVLSAITQHHPSSIRVDARRTPPQRSRAVELIE